MKKGIKKGMLFLFYRIVFPMQYFLHKQKPLDEKKAVFIELNRADLSESLYYLYQEMDRQGTYHLHTHFIRQNTSGQFGYVRHVCSCLKDMATARYVFVCEGNRFTSCLRLRKETALIQLWHGCGAFKKFGESTANALFGGTKEEYQKYPYYKNYRCVTVSSPEVVWAYEEAMGLPADSGIVKPLGVSRTDVFFDPAFQKKAKERLRRECPWIGERKVILYAPTFRGQTSQAKAPDALDVAAMAQALSGEYVLLIKQHPAVKERTRVEEGSQIEESSRIEERPQIEDDSRIEETSRIEEGSQIEEGSRIEKGLQRFAEDVTEKFPIDELLCVSDVCISDYSSLVFEYSLFERPMVFFAYDLEEYGDWRGFYYPYEEMAPGPIVRTTEEIISYIKELENGFDREKIRAFRNKFMSACDGNATRRILEAAQK